MWNSRVVVFLHIDISYQRGLRVAAFRKMVMRRPLLVETAIVDFRAFFVSYCRITIDFTQYEETISHRCHSLPNLQICKCLSCIGGCLCTIYAMRTISLVCFSFDSDFFLMETSDKLRVVLSV